MKKYQYVFLGIAAILILGAAYSSTYSSSCNPSALRSVQFNQKGPAVESLQGCLNYQGYKTTDPAGVYGTSTQSAVKKFYLSWWGKWDGMKIGPLGVNRLKVSLTSSKSFKGFKKFSSEAEFKKYFEKAAALREGGYGGGVMMPVPMAADGGAVRNKETNALMPPIPGRFSETNVQVKGIDEPDIIKTDGKNIYFSPEMRYYWAEPRPLPATDAPQKIMPPIRQNEPVTSVVGAFPLDKMALLGKIEDAGNLLLSGNNLIVVSGNRLSGYDVTNPAAPIRRWVKEMESRNQILESRLSGGKLYVVTASYAGGTGPCAVPLWKANGRAITLPCTDIYYPDWETTVDSIYTANIVNPATGAEEKTLSFVGQQGQTTVYMSEQAIYLAYSKYTQPYQIFSNFLKEDGKGLLPADLENRLARIDGYDLSQGAKYYELNRLIDVYRQSLDQTALANFNNRFQERLTAYYKKHLRDLNVTGLVKINATNLSLAATGEIPGRLLNQYSLDEHKGNLRAAVTLGDGGLWIAGASVGNNQGANDVYVLDGSLKMVGAVRDLGLEERIFSARFIGDRGYLVTFRQIDPFYVLDLSNPTNPRMTGELKIPGFSSYLHPLTDNIILGVGQENSRVKLSLFDISNPARPLEVSKFSLDEYWSEVASNPRAFLQDAKHQVFFLSAGDKGYVFSYAGNKIEVRLATSQTQIRRAIFVDDYLYIVGNTGISVYDENNWTKVKELKETFHRY